MAAITICSDFRAQEEEICHCFHISPLYLPWSNGARCHDLGFFLIFSFKPTLSVSSFTLIKRLFNSSSLSAIRVVSSAYLRLLIFLMVISWLIRKDPHAGKDWRQEKKGMTEEEMVTWHHWSNGHEFGQAPGDGEGQGSLVCCSPWGHKDSDTTEELNSKSWFQLVIHPAWHFTWWSNS